MVLVVGLAVVGFVDDYLGVRARPQPRAAQAGQDGRRAARRRAASRCSRSTGSNVSTHLSFTRQLDLDLGHVHLVRRRDRGHLGSVERREPHRRDGRPRGRVGDARVRGVHDHLLLAVPPLRASTACSPRRRSTSRWSPAAFAGRVRRVPLVERRAGARSSWATRARSRSAARWRASRCSATRPAAADPRRPLRDRDAERDRAGGLVPWLPPAGAAHGADPPPLRGGRLARVHGDRAVLAVRRRRASRSGSGSSTPTSSTSPG